MRLFFCGFKQKNPPLQVKGFSLIELIVSMAIIGILLSVALPTFQGFMRKSRLQTSFQVLESSLSTARSESRSKREMWAVFGEKGNDFVQMYRCGQDMKAEEQNQCTECGYVEDFSEKAGIKGSLVLEDKIILENSFSLAYFPPHGDIFTGNSADFIDICWKSEAPAVTDKTMTITVADELGNKESIAVYLLSGLTEHE